ncbi:MAG: DUF1326 domain-containing protein [Terriglobia bacterium]
MSKTYRSRIMWTLGVLLVMASTVAGRAWGAGDEKVPYRATVLFVEGCSCSIPCTCEMGEMKHGCQGVGAFAFTAGTYKGVSLAGAKLAYATSPGNWIRIYLQTKDAKQQEALADFAKKAMADFGKVEDVTAAKIEITGTGGKYTLAVDGGKIIQLETEPVLGLDKKTPMSYANTFNPLSPTVFQGKTVKGSYQDGGHSFTLATSNSYFNPGASTGGTI